MFFYPFQQVGDFFFWKEMSSVSHSFFCLLAVYNRVSHVRENLVCTATELYWENRFEVKGENLIEYDLFFNTETVDFDKPVIITTQKIQNQNNKLVAGEKKISYKNKLKKDLAVLLYGYKNFRDPHRLYDAKVNILLETTLVQSL